MELNIRQIRKHFQMTQTEFGQILGISGRVVSNIETQRRLLTGCDLEKIRAFCLDKDKDFDLEKFVEASSPPASGWVATVTLNIEKSQPVLTQKELAELHEIERSIEAGTKLWNLTSLLIYQAKDKK